jgi:hypothetical protein
MKNINLTLSFKGIARIFQRYHLTLFIVFVTAGLSVAVVTFSNLLTQSSTDTTYTSPISAGTIDQATLDRITALHTSDATPAPLVTLSGRIDPFSE